MTTDAKLLAACAHIQKHGVQDTCKRTGRVFDDTWRFDGFTATKTDLGFLLSFPGTLWCHSVLRDDKPDVAFAFGTEADIPIFPEYKPEVIE
jgi:hypothetical protein